MTNSQQNRLHVGSILHRMLFFALSARQVEVDTTICIQRCYVETYLTYQRFHSIGWLSGKGSNRITISPEDSNGRQAAYYMTSADGGVSWESPEQLLLATEANTHEVWAQGVAGTESYAIALISPRWPPLSEARPRRKSRRERTAMISTTIAC